MIVCTSYIQKGVFPFQVWFMTTEVKLIDVLNILARQCRLHSKQAIVKAASSIKMLLLVVFLYSIQQFQRISPKCILCIGECR